MAPKPTTLSQYYTSRGQNLPSVPQRAQMYNLGPSYTGTASQNINLLNQLMGGKIPNPSAVATGHTMVKSTGGATGVGVQGPSYSTPGTTTHMVSPKSAFVPPSQQKDQNPIRSIAGKVSGFVSGTPDWVKVHLAEIEKKYGVPTNISSALLKQESGFNPNVTSGAGAIGIAQFMPGTAQSYGINPWDPVQSIDAMGRYISNSLKTFGGDMSKAIASYNAGVGAVQHYGGVPPYQETQNYVKNILGMAGKVSDMVVPNVYASESAPKGQTSQPQIPQTPISFSSGQVNVPSTPSTTGALPGTKTITPQSFNLPSSFDVNPPKEDKKRQRVTYGA